MNYKVLFISHDASRSGAPMVLLFLVKWLKANTDIKIEILLLEDGPLKGEFKAVVPTYTRAEILKENLLFTKITRRIRKKTSEANRNHDVYRILKARKFNLVYGNTVLSLPLLRLFRRNSRLKCVCAVHELTLVIEAFFAHSEASQMLQEMDLIIAGSRAVRDNLVHNFDLSPKKVETVHAFIETDIAIHTEKNDLREQLGIAPHEFVLGAAGAADIRKGIDLVLPLVQKLRRDYAAMPVKIVWLGGSPNEWSVRVLKHDLKMLGLSDAFIFQPHTPYPNDYINLYDVFLLLSREDPFPLVAITAAKMQKPVIAFNGAGGATEMLESGAGIIVPYLDLAAVANAAYQLYQNLPLRKEIGKHASARVLKEFSPDVIPGKTWSLLQSLL